jgi:hypothetical protein
MKILTFFKENTWTIWTSVIIILIIALFVMRSHYAKEVSYITNQLADESKLKVVLQVDNVKLSTRIANVNQDFEKATDTIKILREYRKRDKVEIISLSSLVTKFELKNAKIQGKLDSLGTGADFETETPYYSLWAHVNYIPPLMEVLNLTITDSSFVLLAQREDGLLEGAVCHSNPFINDLNAKFQYRYSPINDKSNFVNYLEVGGIGIGIGGIIAGDGRVLIGGVLIIGVIEGIKTIF